MGRPEYLTFRDSPATANCSPARTADCGTSHPAERREVLLLLLIISALEVSLYLRV